MHAKLRSRLGDLRVMRIVFSQKIPLGARVTIDGLRYGLSVLANVIYNVRQQGWLILNLYFCSLEAFFSQAYDGLTL